MPYKYALSLPNAVCEQCSAPFRGTPSLIAAGYSRFCTMECRRAHAAAAKTETSCATCGAQLFVLPSRMKKTNTHFCTRECRDFAQRGPRRSADESLWLNVSKSVGCWEWKGHTDPNGYGRINIGRKPGLTHRLAWRIASKQEITSSQMVLHTCDNPPCVRNDDSGVYIVRGVPYPRFGHLWLGDAAANAADRVDKGRSATGERNGTKTHPERFWWGKS